MRILITFAVDAEFAPWRKIRPFKRVRVNPDHYSGGVEVFEAQICKSTVWVFLTGIGIKFFDFEAGHCFRDAGVNLVLSAGLAGSLKPERHQQEIVAPTRVGNLRNANGVALDSRISRFAEQCGANSIDMLLTADHIVETAGEKKRLGQFGEAVDMESFHVATHFIEDVPVGVVRAISDGSDQDLPVDFARCLTSEGRLRIGALSKELLVAPSKLPALVKFGRQSRDAAEKLVIFLDGMVARLTPDVLAAEPSEVGAT
jgi:nucleoside phosphorylase